MLGLYWKVYIVIAKNNENERELHTQNPTVVLYSYAS